ncbi:MAG: TRAP transporter small permease subunit [Azospirillum sp.]|nr:TRAP transporter small permease subunit [Azospirillum sp.]
MSGGPAGPAVPGKGAPPSFFAAEDGFDQDPPIDLAPEDAVTFVAFWALVGIVFFQFFMRYVVNDSPPWTEEISRYVLVGVVFLGAARAVRRRTMIAVEFVHAYLAPRRSNAILAGCDLACAAFYGYGAWLGLRLVGVMQFQPMAVVDLPMSLVYGVVTAGFALMALRAGQSLWRRCRGLAG